MQKKIRELKVYEQSGYQYKRMPVIMLKGQWLKDLGFDSGDKIRVVCSNGRLVITKADEGVDAWCDDDCDLMRAAEPITRFSKG